MTTAPRSPAPPFCPNPRCPYHRGPTRSWPVIRAGFFPRRTPPLRVQRFQCCHCRRHFSAQTFRTTYWLRRPELQLPIFHRLLGCSGFRQIAREFEVSPQTVLAHAARLGRHCLLFHQQHRPTGSTPEPLALDGFESFEFSQYHPTRYHVLVGQRSHFLHGFTVTELRRSGRMTQAQKRRRQALEVTFGRPDPGASPRDVATLLALVLPEPQSLTLHTDEHDDYPRALRRLPHLSVDHRTISSRAARTPTNPLFPVNLLDLLIRHSGANHKRETIAFSKRRQSAADRLWVLAVWRNFVKSFSERRPGTTPAMRLGLRTRPLRPAEILGARLFPSRTALPAAWRDHYWRRIPTRRIPNFTIHRCTYAA